MNHEELVLTIAEVCTKARVGRTKLYADIRDGKLRARKNGRRTVVLADDLRAYVDHLPELKPKRAE